MAVDAFESRNDYSQVLTINDYDFKEMKENMLNIFHEQERQYEISQ